MTEITATIYIAWTNNGIAFGNSEEAVIEELFDDAPVEPFRVAKFALDLPRIETADGGTLSVSGARPALKLIGGTDAS